MTGPQAIRFVTPVGRIVQGDLYKAQTTDFDDRPLVDRNGQPRKIYFIALAIPKSDPGLTALFEAITRAGIEGFPSLHDANGKVTRADFAYKFKNGDDPAHKGKEGFAGCWVFNFSSGYSPDCYTRGGDVQIIDPREFKCGDYARVSGSTKGNGSDQKPGIFLNLGMVEKYDDGAPISVGPDAKEVFNEAATYAGTVDSPAAANVPGVPGVATPAAGVPDVPGIEPHTTITDAPQPAARTMTAKAGATTYEQFIASGKWTDELLVKHGMMLPV